jgi:O-antigen/teichoic acid export membrane protein
MVWRALAKDSAIYGGADLTSKAVALISFPLIAAALNPSDFGSLELILTGTTLLGLVANCGLNNAIQRFYWDPEVKITDQAKLVSSGFFALSFNCLMAIFIGAIISISIAPFLMRQQFPISIYGMIASLMLMAGTQVGQYLLDVTRLHLAPWRFMMVSLVSRVLASMAGVLAVVWLGWGLDGLLTLQAIVALLAIPIGMLAVSKDLKLDIDKNVIARLLKFGHPFIYASVAFWLFGAMDRWILAAISSVEEVGLYAVGHRLATIVLFVSIAFGQAWSPLAIKIRTDYPSQYRSIYVSVLLVLFFIMIMVSGTMSLFSGELVSLLMPPEYAGAAMPLAILSMGVALQSTQQVTAVGISLEKKTHLFARLSWITAIINLLLNLALIPHFGALGAAWATAISYLVLTVCYLFYTQMLHPLPLDKYRLAALSVAWLVLAITAILLKSDTLNVNLIISKFGILLSIILICVIFAPWKTLSYVK